MHGSIPSNNRECRWDNVVCMALYSHKFFLSSYWTCIFTVVSRNVSHKSRNLCIQNIYSRKQILHRSYRQIKVQHCNKNGECLGNAQITCVKQIIHLCGNSPDNYRPRFFAKYCGNTRNSKVITSNLFRHLWKLRQVRKNDFGPVVQDLLLKGEKIKIKYCSCLANQLILPPSKHAPPSVSWQQ